VEGFECLGEKCMDYELESVRLTGRPIKRWTCSACGKKIVSE